MMRNRIGTGLLMFALAVPAAALAQTAAPAPTPPVDVISDVVVSGRNTPTDKADIIVARMPRVARCMEADTFNHDPTKKFNQAYYEELTGQADYYDRIREPPPKVVYRYPPPIHRPMGGLAKLSSPMSVPGYAPILGMGGSVGTGQGNAVRPVDTTCEKRGRMENNTSLARAMAMLDKGEEAKALPALIEVSREMAGTAMAAEAALMIAGVYLRGEGVPRDMTQAIAWLERAASAPIHPRARDNFDPQQPGRYNSVAAEAASALGRIYMTGAGGVALDEKAARHWVQEAVRARHVPAIKVLGDMYYTGYGGPLNLRTALLHYERAGAAKHATSLIYAAEMYETGEGTRLNLPRATDFYLKAAQLDDGRGYYGVARRTEQGRVPAKALGFYKTAAEKGNAKALTALGTYFYKGELIGKNLATARALFEEAAMRGDPDGMVNLAAMLIAGEGGGVDHVKAWAWLTISQAGGREDVAPGLAQLETRMKPEEVAAAKALIGG